MGQPINLRSASPAARKRPRGHVAPGLDVTVVRDVAAYHLSHPQAAAGRLDIVRTRRDRPAQLQRRTPTLPTSMPAPGDSHRHHSTGDEDDEDDDDEDDDDDDDDDYDGNEEVAERDVSGVTVIYKASEGLYWELGWWPNVSLSSPSALDVFQIVLDVLAETVDACRIGTLRVRDNLHRLQGVADALHLLCDISLDRGAVNRDQLSHQQQQDLHHGRFASTFQHPITGDPIRIVVCM
jgi:hypothetical protein